MPSEAPIQVKTKLRIFSGLPSLVLYFCVFFILLVFFMLSSNFVPLRGVEVDLPRSGGRLIYTSRSYVVTIDKDSRIFFKDKPITLDELEQTLKAMAAEDPDVPVLVRGDERLDYGSVMNVVKVVYKCKVRRMALVTVEK